MYTDQELCQKIREMYPELGECGVNIEVSHDDEQKVWIVDLKKGDHHLKHYLEYPDADKCMWNQKCVSLGLEIAQMKKLIDGLQF